MADYLSQAAADAHSLEIRVTKRTAWLVVRDLIAAGNIAGLEAAQLYQYFQPTPPKRPKTRFDWLCQAIDKKDIRPYLHFVHVDSDGRGIATDGNVLLIDPRIGLAPGFYDTAGTPVAEDLIGGTYPNVWRVVPTGGCRLVEPGVIKDWGGSPQIQFPAADGATTAFPLDQWNRFWVEGSEVRQPDNRHTPVKITHPDGRIAIIMPLRKVAE